MNSILLGIIIGLIFGGLDLVPMIKMALPDKRAAMTGAFINRFAIGFLSPTSLPGVDPIIRGLLLGILLSLPDAIITKVYAPILGIGALGGLAVGVVTRLVGVV